MYEIICLIPLIPIRREPNHRSEMISQMLFGEKATILSTNKEWIEIETKFDSYQGWIEQKSASSYKSRLDNIEWTITSKPISIVKRANSSFLISCGSEIPLSEKSNSFILNSETYELVADNDKPIQNPTKKVIEIAYEFINAPYLWGGRSIFGIDCSGFSQILFKNIGITLPRDAKDQAEKGILVGSIKESLPGDLLFFNNENGMIVHVGMLLPHNKIIHSSVYVRVDSVDEHGIYNEKENTYTHNLKVIKRLIC
jgi:gamma-D-glutamyl-L-lysine dipeptidyl-peptidase